MRPRLAAIVMLSTCFACYGAVAAQGQDDTKKPTEQKSPGDLIETAPPSAGSPAATTAAPKATVTPKATAAPQDDSYPTTATGEIVIDP
jgi:hypothetical protein